MAGVTPDSLRLSWTVARGPFDSFVVQYKDAQGQPQAVPVGADQSELTVPGLEPNRKYKMNLYGLRGRQRVGPASVVARTGESEPLGPCCSLALSRPGQAPLPSSAPFLAKAAANVLPTSLPRPAQGPISSPPALQLCPGLGTRSPFSSPHSTWEPPMCAREHTHTQARTLPQPLQRTGSPPASCAQLLRGLRPHQ